MATQVQNRRGTTAEHSTFTGAVGEVTIDTDKDTVVVHDGATAGGHPLMKQTGSQDLTTSGNILLTNQGDIRLGEATANGSNFVALQAPAALAADITYTLPDADGTSGQVLSTNGSGTLSWATAAAGGASVTTSDTAPSSPSDGDLWYDSVGGRTYVYYDDGNTSQWVDAAPQGGGGTSITVGNTTAEVVDTGSDGRFVVTTEGTEALRVDSSRRLLVGTSSSRNVAAANQRLIQVESTSGDGGISVVRNSNDTTGGRLVLAKSRGTSVGSNTIVQDGDDLGGLIFAGADGTDLQSWGAQILAEVDGTPGANDLPTRLLFGTTADGASSPTERMRIDSVGRLLMGTSSSSNTNVRAIFQATPAAPTGTGFIFVTMGRNNPVSGQQLGAISFSDNNHTTSASIAAVCDGGWTSGTDQPTRLAFYTTADGLSSVTERMRISNAGFVGINNTNPSNYLSIVGDGATASIRSRQGPTSSVAHIVFNNNNGDVGTITTNASSTAYNTSSDYRLKENVTPVTDGITRLQQLKPSRFNFIAEPDTTVDGFLAHEVQTIVPEAITGEKDAVDDEGNPVYQGIDQSKLVPLLTAALQEAIERIETLETTNASQAATIAAIEARLTALEGGN